MQTETQTPPLRSIVLIASIAAGVQFGWALQLSLLTPYVQLLGIPHRWASLLWLCGPISGLLVQPIVGQCSDRCTSRFGRRRPFIAAGTVLVSIAVVLIGYAADLGRLLGDPLEKTPKTRAIAIFAVGFWILDVANNMLQGPCRAFLADLSAESEKKTQIANGFFSFFMAVGHVLGFAAGSYGHLHEGFPWTLTRACDVYCANLKSCFFISVLLLLILTVTALCYVREKQWSPGSHGEDETDVKTPLCGGICGSVKDLKRPTWMLLIVTALNWTAWFPFLLFDTDWMGREVYGGDSAGTGHTRRLYDSGVRMGTLGLMLTAIVVGLVSLGAERLARALGGVTRLWGVANFLLAICLAATVVVTKFADSERRFIEVATAGGGDGGGYSPAPPSQSVKIGALSLFGLLGIPQAITHIVPFALASVYSSRCGAGQGLSMGVLNIAISAPQLVISVGAGPFDEMCGGGNLPGFIAGAVAAAASGVLAFTLLS